MKTFIYSLLFAAICLGDDGKLTIYMGGKQIASETYSIQKGDGKVQVDGSGKAEIGTMKVDIERFNVVADDKYQLISASAKASLGQVKIADEATFSDGKAKNDITSGPEPKVKEDDIHPDAIVINSNLPLFPWSMLALRAKLDTSEPQAFYAYILGQKEVPLTVVFKGRESVEFAGKKAELNHLSASLSIAEGQTTKLEFWVNDERKLIKVIVPSQGAEAYQDGWSRKAPVEVEAEKKQP
ncbi:MAG: hypothetical protein ACR2NN_22005 [Bryobacteraceae bacterium]